MNRETGKRREEKRSEQERTLLSLCLRSAAVPSEGEREGNARATESGDGDGCRAAGAAAMVLLSFGGWTRCALVRRRQ